MTGAEILLQTLAANGVEVCFMNPGTSEMHFVAALDRVAGCRGVLCLFEGVCAGAADGLRILKAGQAGHEVDNAGKFLEAAKFGEAAKSQQSVINTLKALLEKLGQ